MLGFYNYTVILTYMGFISGAVGISLAFTGNPTYATICLLLAGLFDMFDGKVASTKKDRSEDEKKFGIQIDSLSDLVCFGVLPAAIGYSIGLTSPYWYILFSLYSLSALIRLAYFNVIEEKRQHTTSSARTSYSGVPVTTSSLLFPLIYFACRFVVGFDKALPDAFSYVYAAFLLICAVLFVAKFLVVPKIHGKGIFICAAIFVAAVALALFIVLSFGK